MKINGEKKSLETQGVSKKTISLYNVQNIDVSTQVQGLLLSSMSVLFQGQRT